MWTCPKCRSRVDDDFEVCWSCGTTPEGVEDPEFVTADEAEPIESVRAEFDPKIDELLGDEFGDHLLPNLVECYLAGNTIEAKFIADRLIEQGIPALADSHDLGLMLGGFKPQLWGNGPRVRVRPEDLDRAVAWINEYERHRKAKQDRGD